MCSGKPSGQQNKGRVFQAVAIAVMVQSTIDGYSRVDRTRTSFIQDYLAENG